MSDLFILSLPTAFDAAGKLKVSDLFILLLPTAFDVAGSFCFYFFFIKPLWKKGVRFIYSLTPDCVWRGREFLFYGHFKIEANIMNKSNDSTNTNNKEVSERIKGVWFIYYLTFAWVCQNFASETEKRCQIYLFPYSRLRLTRPGVFVFIYCLITCCYVNLNYLSIFIFC